MKAQLRRFAEILGQEFGIHHLEFARLKGRGSALALRRRPVRAGGVEPLAEGLLERVAKLLSEAVLSEAEWRDGVLHLACEGRRLSLAFLEDPRADGTLVVWEEPEGQAPGDPQREALLDLLVRGLQNEARWFAKLDSTQALLYRDDLTGLFNTRYFEVALESELRRAERFKTQFCLLFIDLDGFKPINDRFGHLSGSAVLRQVADVIREAVREVDVPIRYGGDEFVVLLLGATCAKGVLAAERVRRKIEHREFRLADQGVARLTCSIGVAAYPEHGRDRETLLRVADETMYDSKRAGKNRVTVIGRRDEDTA